LLVLRQCDRGQAAETQAETESDHQESSHAGSFQCNTSYSTATPHCYRWRLSFRSVASLRCNVLATARFRVGPGIDSAGSGRAANGTRAAENDDGDVAREERYQVAARRSGRQYAEPAQTHP